MSENKRDIYGAYDIRGIYPGEINKEVAYKLGKSFVYLFKTKKVVVGRDQRESSPVLFESLVKGIRSMGCNVIDIGFSTTPLFNYSVGRLKTDGGIMITASHNPKEYNGFKLTREKAVPLNEKEISRLGKIVESKNVKEKPKEGNMIEKDLTEDFVKKVVSYADLPKKKLKVVVDTGNGMSGLTVPDVFSKLPLSGKYLYKKIDQTYPNHPANPLEKKNMKDLQEKVVKEKADIGIAFDGDGDRAGFVDEKGKIVNMDLVTALISEYLLKKKRNKGSKVIYDLRSSWVVRDAIKNNGGRPIETRVGHSFIKRKMNDSGAIFAGETSGHYYFRDFYNCENSILAALIVFNNLKRNSFSEVMSDFQKYYKSEEINFNVDNPEKKIKEVKRKYSSGKVSTIDGVKIEFEDWWFNLRKSNTEYLLRLNLEAKTKKLRDEKIKELKGLIRE